MNTQEKYAIRSKLTGKWLTSLFSDSHDDTFTRSTFKPPCYHDGCYLWNTREIAEHTAKQLNGEVVALSQIKHTY